MNRMELELSGRKTVIRGSQSVRQRGIEAEYRYSFLLDEEMEYYELEPRYELRDYDWLTAYIYKGVGLPWFFDRGVCFLIDINGEGSETAREFREKGTVSGAYRLERTEGKTWFRAKKPSKLYEGQTLYMYGLAMAGGYWRDCCFCMMYPSRYLGTPEETAVMAILDEAVETYEEKKIAKL